MAHEPSTICRCMYLRVPSMVWSVPTVPESPLSSVISSVPYRPDEGEILIDGENIRENASIKEKIAYIPDEILSHFSQATTLDMMHYYKGLYPSFDEQSFL